MAEKPDEALEKARQLALESAEQRLPESFDYIAELDREEPDVWILLVRPEGRIRGASAQVIVSKKAQKVVETIFLQ